MYFHLFHSFLKMYFSINDGEERHFAFEIHLTNVQLADLFEYFFCMRRCPFGRSVHIVHTVNDIQISLDGKLNMRRNEAKTNWPMWNAFKCCNTVSKDKYINKMEWNTSSWSCCCCCRYGYCVRHCEYSSATHKLLIKSTLFYYSFSFNKFSYDLIERADKMATANESNARERERVAAYKQKGRNEVRMTQLQSNSSSFPQISYEFIQWNMDRREAKLNNLIILLTQS